MASVSVYDAKTHLSRLLRRVRAGEDIVISDNGRPIARLVPVDAARGRQLGGDEDAVFVAEDFDAPLPDGIVDAFYPGIARGRVAKRAAKKPSRRR
jgi:prevent-host-death family protein